MSSDYSIETVLKDLECVKPKPSFKICYLTAQKMFTLIILDVKSL